MSKIGRRIGFTELELKVIFFLVLTFFVGIVLYYMKYKTEYLTIKQYDYSVQDSIFHSALNVETTIDSVNKIVEKRVDSEQELLDFRTPKLSSTDKDKSNLGIHVNINSASIDVLKQLPGIGEKTAEKIVDFRNKNGHFKNINELMLVSGIGQAKFNRIKEYIFIE